MDPNTPSQPPHYSNPPSYMSEEHSTPTDGQNSAAVRLLTSMDESSSRPYVPPCFVPRHLAPNPAQSSKFSARKPLSSLKEEEEAMSFCKLQKSQGWTEANIMQFLPCIPDGPSRRESLTESVHFSIARPSKSSETSL